MLILSNIFQSIRNSEYSVKKINVRQIRVWPVPFVNLGYFVFNCFWGLECFSDLVLRSAVIFKTYMQPTNWLETNCSFLLSKRLTLLAALCLYKSTTLKAETVSGWSGRHMFWSLTWKRRNLYFLGESQLRIWKVIIVIRTLACTFVT